jgi:hypothetical protein
MILIAFLWGNFSFAQQKVLTEKEKILIEKGQIKMPEASVKAKTFTKAPTNSVSLNRLVKNKYRGTAYAVDALNNNVVSFNLNSPGTLNTISTITPTGSDFICAGSWADNTWYVSEYGANTLGTIDPSDGTYTVIGSFGVGIDAMAYDNATNTMYGAGYDGISNSQLYTINLSTGTATFVGDIGYGIIIGIACNASGTLYAANLDDNLYTINKTTGASTVIGPLGISINYAQDLEYDNENGILYLAGYTSFASLYTINPSTGAASLVGDFPSSTEICGLAIPYNPVTYTNDVALQSIMSPVTGSNLTSTEPVIVRAKNNGTVSQSNIAVSYTLNGGAAVNEVIAGPIAAGVSIDYTFTQTADLSVVQSYEIVATATLAGDENPNNNSKTKNVTNLGNLVLMQNGTVTACSGNFYDTGGPDGTYQNNEDITMTIAPSTPGAKMKFNFTAFDCENNWDFLKVYDGADVNAPMIGNFTGASIPAELVELIASPSNTSGAITFHFTSDNSVLHLGWAATMSCVSTITHDMAALSVSGNATPILGTATNYTVTVANASVSAELGSNYTVLLYDANNTLIGSANGVNIAGGQTKTFVFSWTPTTLGATHLYGKVVLTGDENPANDQTPNFNVNVIQGGSNPPIYANDFESFTVGRQVACQDPTNWTTWSNTPCSPAEDALISTDFANGGIKAVKVELANDLVLHLGNKTTGKYKFDFSMYIPSNFCGYYNVLQDFAGGSSKWGLEVYFHTDGTGLVNAGANNAATFTYVHNQWLPIKNIIDLDNDLAELIINGVSIYSWQWSLGANGTGGVNQLSASDFFAGADANFPTDVPKYYFDDVEYTVAPAAPTMVITPQSLTVTLAPNGTIDQTVQIANNGDCMLNWTSTLVTNGKRSVTPLQFTAEPRVGGSATGETSPMHTTTIGNPIRAIWDILFTFNGNYAAQPGVETDGQYIYTSSWQTGYGSWFHKYDLNGNWIEDFDIAGVTAIRDMAYDGQYFYGGANGSTIYQMDFTNKVLVGTINTSVAGVRHIAYDSQDDAFWCGGWSDIQEVDRSGAIINSGSTGLSGMYGSAYDPWTAGGPYLWIFDQGGNGVDIQQYSIANGALTGVMHDASDIPGFIAGSSIAGGLCISNTAVAGKIALIGNMQEDPEIIFAYDLGEATAPWITCTPASGTIIPGASQNVTVHFDATELTEGTYTASITYTSDPNIGTIIVPVTLNVHNDPQATVTIGTLSNVVAGPISVPVHAALISNMGSFQFSIEYNPALLTYTGTSNWYSGINAVTVGNPSPGHLTFVWAAETEGVNIPDGNFFNIDFTWNGGANQTSTVVWSDDPTPREFSDYNGVIFTPSYVNGSVTGSNGPIPTVTIATLTNVQPGPLSVPVHAANIVNMGSFQFSIEYNPAIMTYTGTSNWHTGIDAVTVGNPASGKLTFVWAADLNGVNITDGTFFNLNFNYISGATAINWSDNPIPREFGDYDGNIFEPIYVNGSVTGSNGPIPTVTIATLTNVQPGPVSVPVQAANIVNMGSFQFSIEYNPALLTYTGTSNWHTGIDAVSVGNSSPGNLTFVWAADMEGINIPDGNFFNIDFTWNGGANQTSTVIWSDNPTPREFADYNGIIFVPTYINGSISGSTSPQPILSVTPANQNVTSPSGTTTFAVSNTGTGSMSYSAQVTSGNNWLTITNGATGGNNGTIVVMYSQNNSSFSRVGTIMITAPGAIGSPRQVTVTQATAPPPSPELTIGTVNTNPGTVIVPVTARNLINLGSFQFSIFYDASKLTYVKDTNWYAGITEITINSSIPGKISFVWAADFPITISNNTLFEMKFNAINLGTLAITWTDDPTPREFADWDGNNFEPVYVNGGVTIAAPLHFVFEGGNPADPVWTIYLSQATLDDMDLQPLDEIAIFDGTTMVGAYRLTEVLTPGNVTDNYITAFKTLTNGPGYTPGHSYSFKCWDASLQTEINYANVSLLNPWGDAYTGNVFPENDGEYSIADIDFLTAVTHSYNLNTGYQFISSYITPPNSDMSVVLAELMNNNLSFVRSSGGDMFRKLGPNWVNNIGNWVITEGYLVKMNAPDDFSITGTPVEPLTPIILNTGYQFISYFHDYPMDAFTAFAGIMNDNLSFIRNSGGNMLRKLGPNWVNNIGNVVPGEGYLAKMNAPATLIYPAGTKSESIKNNMAIQHFSFEGGNAADPVYTIYISDATINGYNLQAGDEIGVFDGQTLVGSLALTQTPTPENQTENAIPVFATLNSGEGFTANHPVTYKVWSASQGQEYDGVSVMYNNPYGDAYTGNVFPTSDGIYSIASLTATLTGINSLDRTEVAVYPNPSNGTFTLELNSVKSQNFDVTIYNSLGVVVYQQLNVASNGKYSTEIGSGDLPEGIYTLTVTGKDANYIKKIVIRK